jgi:DNA-directed RNA polymerase subunit RPC12/RpoP
MFCPECGGKITPTGAFNLVINGSGEYICESCNIKISIYEEELEGDVRDE